MFEEIELLTGCLMQLFANADKWASINYPQYSQIKDMYLYSLPRLFIDTKSILPGSSTEQYLNSIWMDNAKREVKQL